MSYQIREPNHEELEHVRNKIRLLISNIKANPSAYELGPSFVLEVLHSIKFGIRVRVGGVECQ